MSTATNPPRCPHRVAITKPNRWLTVLLAGLLGSSTATVSLHGQEMSLLDYRFVVPAGHMQPWPDVEPDILIVPQTPDSSKTMRIAAKWRTNLSPKREEKPSTDKNKLPDPAPGDAESDVEVLVVPSIVPHRVPRNVPKGGGKRETGENASNVADLFDTA